VVRLFIYCRFLTARQQELNLRRAKAENALALMQQLDEEEKEIEKLEAQVATFAASCSVDVNESTLLSGSFVFLFSHYS